MNVFDFVSLHLYQDRGVATYNLMKYTTMNAKCHHKDILEKCHIASHSIQSPATNFLRTLPICYYSTTTAASTNLLDYYDCHYYYHKLLLFFLILFLIQLIWQK